MVPERRNRILRSRCAVWIGKRTDCRITHRRGVERYQRLLPELIVVQNGEFHKEVMRMLTIDDRLAESGFALLKQFRIAPLGYGGWFQAQHALESQGSATKLALRHEHPPVCRKQLVGATRPGLLDVI